MMKNAFYFALKALFVLKIFKFLSWLWSCKKTVNFKIYDVITWLTNNCNTYLHQYLRKQRQSNQTMKFGQLIEYHMINIFLKKSYIKCGGETIPRLFYKKSKLSICLDQQSKVLYSLFFFIPSGGLSKFIETKLQTTCFYLILSFFKKQKEFWN